MTKKDYDDHDNIEDLQEWSDKQYNPGHWTGGNIPPHMKRGNLGKLCGYYLLVLGVFVVLPGIGMLVFDSSNNVGQKVIVIVIGFILSIAGYKKIK
ncbi:MAG: hypothetical protein FH758_12035 [Firmicutes bacterium]|nr:hypothetical protein [Bacillota bacterium]